MSARTKHLKVLGLDEKADEATIKKAFKKLALLYHPDRNSNNVEEATERFKQINEAHTYLTSGAAPSQPRPRTPPPEPEPPARPATPEPPSRPPPPATQPEPPPPRPTPQRPPAETEADLRRAAEARRQVQETEARRRAAAAARKREADEVQAKERAAAVAARKREADELAAQTTLAEIAARRQNDRRVEQRQEAVDAARAKKDAKLRRKAAKVEEAVMDWPARFWNWCRNNLYHYGYFKSIYGKNASVRPLRSTFESLGLKEDDVARLHEQFVIIDKDGSGAIELWELLDYLDLQRNRFAKRVFAIFDADGSNQIDFKEFVVALWQSVRGVRGTASRRWRRRDGVGR